MEKSGLYAPAALLKRLYEKIRVVADAEEKKASQMLHELEELAGELTEDNLVDALSEAQNLFAAFRNHNIPGYGRLREQYESLALLEKAAEILRLLAALKAAETGAPVEKFAAYSANITGRTGIFLRDMREIEQAAQTEKRKAVRNLEAVREASGLDRADETANQELAELFDRIEAMEVRSC